MAELVRGTYLGVSLTLDAGGAVERAVVHRGDFRPINGQWGDASTLCGRDDAFGYLSGLDVTCPDCLTNLPQE